MKNQDPAADTQVPRVRLDNLCELLGEIASRVYAIGRMSQSGIDYPSEFEDETLRHIAQARLLADGIASQINCTAPDPGQLETETRGAIGAAESFVLIWRARRLPNDNSLSVEERVYRKSHADNEDLAAAYERLIECASQLGDVAVRHQPADRPETPAPERNLTRPASMAEVARLLKVDVRQVRDDATLYRQQVNPPSGKKWLFDLDEIDRRSPSAPKKLDPER
ncbi:MAG: hypothetical protein AAF711_04940 [Planctomycetota bacterium]